jgi:hypothetical protein
VAGNTKTPGGHRPVVVWDDASVTTTYANQADVTVSGEAINVLFGVEQIRQDGQEALLVQLSKQLTLPPSVAKRLAIDLRNAVGDLETNSGAQVRAPAVTAKERKATAQESPDPSRTVWHLEKILALFRLLGGSDTLIDLEQSFKLVPGRILEYRFLLGLNRRDLGSGADERFASICEGIGMPQNLLASFRQTLADANHVYFGVEKDGQTLMFKAYLEFRDKIEREIRGAAVAGRAFPLFTGFKWDASSPTRQAVTRYAWYPSLPAAEILERLRVIVEAGAYGELVAIVRGIAELALKKVPHCDIQYLEVSEEGNPRRSFDINLYKSDLRLADLFPHLLSSLLHYGVPSDRFEPLYQRIKTERFGHLAGGLDREQKDFITIYYGVKQIHSSQLASASIVAVDRRHEVASKR